MPLSETRAPGLPWIARILSRTVTVVALVADLSGSLDVVGTMELLFVAQEPVLVKQAAKPLAGTCCIYELGVRCPCPCTHSKCIFSRLISCDLSRVDWGGIVPILFVLTWKGTRHYQLTMNKNFVIGRFLTYSVEPVLHNKPLHIWLSLLSKLYGVH